MGQRYPTALTAAEWTLLAPLIPAAKPGGRPRTTDIREVINAILYVLRSGCQWRMLPQDFPPHQTVYHARFAGLQRIWADGGYAGKFVAWVATVRQRTLVIVKRPRHTQGLQVLQ
jgi:transposase